VLLRARRMANTDPAAMTGASRPQVRLMAPAARTVAERPRRQRVQAAEPEPKWSGAAVDRVWLRGTVVLIGTMGAALIAVAVATYLMAVGHDGPSWVIYGLAGVVTAAMPVVEWLHVRQLRRVVAGS